MRDPRIYLGKRVVCTHRRVVFRGVVVAIDTSVGHTGLPFLVLPDKKDDFYGNTDANIFVTEWAPGYDDKTKGYWVEKVCLEANYGRKQK